MTGRRASPSTVAGYVRGMACHGIAPDVIASTLGIEPADVVRMLDRPIHGRLAVKVRALHAAGDSAEAIAIGLGLAVDRVGDFIDRITPRRGTHRGRPRSRAAQARPPGRRKGPPRPRPSVRSEWSGLRGPEYRDAADGVPSAAIAPELGEPGRAEDLGDGQGVDRVEAQAPGPSPATSTAAGEWGSFHATAGRGGSNPNAALTDDGARRMRQFRAEGRTRRELAEAFGCSMATVGRVLAGRTYRDTPPEATHVGIEEPATSPAIAEAEAPRRSVWGEPAGPGPEWRDD